MLTQKRKKKMMMRLYPGDVEGDEWTSNDERMKDENRKNEAERAEKEEKAENS